MEQKGLTEEQKHQAVEGNILMAMFYATCEQSEMRENKFKQREKQIFKNWKNLGDKLFQSSGFAPEHKEYLEKCTDVIHEAGEHIRKKTEEVIVEG